MGSPRGFFVGSGVVALILVCVVPVYSSLSLLKDDSYVFWAGRTVPEMTIAIVFAFVVTYSVMVWFFFSLARQIQGEVAMALIATIFVTSLGVALMLIALPLSQQSSAAYNDLMHSCHSSDSTRRLFEYSQVLQSIRAAPGCAEKYSVEECEGYEEAAPYTSLLRTMESKFHCSGFCYRPLASSVDAESRGTPAIFASLSRKLRRPDGGDLQKVLAPSGLRPDNQEGSPALPLTLFSDANYKASCDGMAGRHMKHFVGSIATSTFYQGVYLVFVAVAMGFLRLSGIVHEKDVQDRAERPAVRYLDATAGARA